MKSFLIIGLGTFGHHLCRELSKLRCEVVICDQRAEALDDLLPLVVSAKVCDCTNPEVLRSLDPAGFDACFVCLGDSFQACLEITDQLKEQGAKRIYSKADRDLEAKFLTRAGADHVIYPEKETAARIAVRESSDQIFDVFELSDTCSVCEISPRAEWIGKSISALSIRPKYGLNVVAVKRGEHIKPVLDPSYTFAEGEHVYVLGNVDDVLKVT